MTDDELAGLEEVLGHRFSRPDLLAQALTHRSFVNEAGAGLGGMPDNERLEFLGDAVLELCVSRALYDRLPTAAEGVLTQLRARVVNTKALARAARGLGLGERLWLGVGEDQTGGRARTSVLADALEAVVCAVYLDAGIEAAMRFVGRALGPWLEEVDPALGKDPKSELQEWAQRRDGTVPRYVVERVAGPDHAAEFEAQAWVGTVELARGRGASKKEAERHAAQGALARVAAEQGPGG